MVDGVISMQKIVGKLYLRPGMQEEYIRRHDEIWPEMKEMMRDAGIHNYTIWMNGEELFEYMEVDDPDRMRTVLCESAVKAKWDEYMSDILIGSDGNFVKAFEFDP